MSNKTKLSDLSDEMLTMLHQKEQTCKRYFLLGFAFLPLLWVINAFWFGAYLWSEPTKAEIETEQSLVDTLITDRKGRRMYRRALKKTKFQCQRVLGQIYFYVVCSFAGFIVWSVVIVAWASIYQTHRVSWGAYGDSISFNVPRGI